MNMKFKPYSIEQFENFDDFFAYCEVENLHFENRPHWSNGVADVILAHGVFGIFDSHTNRGYFINKAAFENENDAKNYAHHQVARCRDKYNVENNMVVQQAKDIAQQRYLSSEK